MGMTFNRFNTYSMKARLSWVQKVLNLQGYNLSVNGKRDRETVKALTKFQKSHGLGGNAVVCEMTYNLLCGCGGSSVSMDK